MVLLPPNSDVLSGDAPLSASTEMASEGTPVKVSVAADTTNGTTITPPTVATAISISTTTTTAASDDVTGATAAMFGSAGPLSPYRPSRVTLGSVYPCITCNLCKGYLIDATTIVECLHSFCHSCIMKHLRTEQYCPQCEMMINKAKPNIKPDATLQAIVYKLVPGLYENELRRRRAFYRLHPDMAAIATPEQRGEDTEYLIFSPNEKISLSLEYAEKELAEDNEELLKAKYLLCPAIFSIALLKKFIIYKYGISERQFCVEIMYKVKTIILPDYYTLMDVAYIYTWKRDAPMKYYYRIRTTESNPVELPEVPLRRSPSLVSAGKQRTEAVDDEDDKENVHLERLVSEVTVGESDNSNSSSCSSDNIRRSENGSKSVEEPKPSPTMQPSPPAGSPATPAQPARKNESIKLKIGLNKNKYVSFLQSPQPDEPAANTYTSPGASVEGSKSHKSEKTKRKRSDPLGALQQLKENSRELQIEIEKMKDMLPQGKLPTEPVSSKREGKSAKKQQLSLAPCKVDSGSSIAQGLQDSERDSKRLHSSKNGSGSSSYRKLKIKSPKSGSSSSSNNSSPEDSKHHHPIVLKIDQRSPDMATATLKFGVPRKADKSMTPSPPPLPPSPPTPPPAKPKFEDEQSQFLNSFDLTPIKTEQSSSPTKSTGTSPSTVESTSSSKKSPTSSANPKVGTATTTTTANATANGSTTQTKRKAKDSAGGATRSGSKKPKLSDDEMKAIVEKTVAENIRSPSEHIVPPIFLKPKVPPVASPSPVTSSRQKSPPLPSSSAKSETKKTTATTTTKTTPPPKRDSPRPFIFKTPPPPPPIVSASNIPAVKPSQQVLPAPIPQKPSLPPIRPASTPKASSPVSKPASPLAPQAPIRKPTTPTKLPTSTTTSGGGASAASQPLNNGTNVAPTNSTTHSVATGSSKQQKPLELKRALSNPSINILPPTVPQTPGMPRDTEISKLRPEDLKKNVKIYGPPTSTEQPTIPARSTETASFAVPNKVTPKTPSNLTVTSATKAAATSTSTSGPQVQGAKARPVNYLNYALLNSKAAAAGSRTPIPSYSSNSPSYSPDSPQYNPNLNFSPKQFKYANPLAYSSHLQNMLTERKSGSTSPPSTTITIPASSPSPPQAKEQTAAPSSASISVTPASNKRPASALSPDAEEKKLQPPEKQATLSSPPNPLDKFPAGIPDGLSVTLATDEDDATRIKNVNKQLKNNFIEIRPLPDVPVTEVKLPLPHPNTIPKQGRRTPPSKVGNNVAGSSMPASTTSVSQVARKSTPPITNPTYSVANSAPAKTSASSTSSNGTADAIQRKIYDIIEKRTSSDGGKSANNKSAQQKPSSVAPTSRPSTPKVPTFPVANKFKHPNATVNENGMLKFHHYNEVDLIPKGVNNLTNNSKSSRMMPPPTTQAKSNVPIAPKPSQQPFANGRMAMSPPIPRSPATYGGYSQPKSKTPPSHLPSMASMGPMFDIQMKSAAIGASGGGTPAKKSPVGSSTTLTSGTVPRRKIVPTNNSTTLVPLKSASSGSSAPSANGGGSKLSGSSTDFITLHPQGPVAPSTPSSPRSLPFSAQQAVLNQMMNNSLLAHQYYPFFLQQYAQQTSGMNMPIGAGSDSVTITASPLSTSRNAVSQNSLTVTAIPPGSSIANGRGSSTNGGGGSGGGNGGVGGPSRGFGGGGPNPASRNSS
ncbi:polycomb group protein Psc [Anopheles maculipalpis]|uniref:polycomb group protein Psc n=1 Tax=Anopheles maculipalpis TaxID=1496333 RepID=UPI002158E4CA|nr:polycomb group protein Psc [Anopheles maculipalpis]